MTDKLKKFIERCGWEVTVEDGYVQLSWRSPAGEDFFFAVDDLEDEDVSYEIMQVANNFDADDHAEMHVANRGRGGTPLSIRTLIDDAEAIDDALDDLRINLALYNPSTLETYQEVQDTIDKRKADEDFNYYDNADACIIHAKFGRLQKHYTGLSVKNGLTEEFVEEFRKHWMGEPSIFETPQDVVKYVITHDLPVIFYSNFNDEELSKAELLEYFNMEDIWKD